MKLLIGIPVLDNVNWRFFLYTTTQVARLAKEYDIAFCTPNRCSIDRARQMCVEAAFKEEADYLLFIDDDTILPLNAAKTLLPLLEPEDVISASGVSFQRGYPYMPMVYRFKDFDFSDRTTANQLVPPFPLEPFEVSANGMGVSLLKVKLLKEIPEPCFGRDGPGTEDFYFYRKASEKKFKSLVHPDVTALHMGEPMLIGPTNADGLRGLSVSSMIPAEFLSKEDGGRAHVCEMEVPNVA